MAVTLNESWENHELGEVEDLLKSELKATGRKISVEKTGARFKVNLLDANNNKISETDWVSTTENDILNLNYLLATLTVKYGDKVEVSFYYEVTNANGDNRYTPASATLLVMFGTTLKKTYSLSNITSGSTTTVDITDYIEPGSTRVIVNLKTEDGEFDLSIYGTILAIKLALSSTFDPKYLYTKGSNINIPYILTSTSGQKTIQFYLDGEIVLTITSSSISPNGTVAIPTSSISSGTHTILIVAFMNNNGTNVYSNSICFTVPIVNSSADDYSGFGAKFEYQDGRIFEEDDEIVLSVGQFTEFTFEYYIVDKQNRPVNLYRINEKGEYLIVSTGNSNEKVSYGDKMYEAGEYTIRVYVGEELIYTFLLDVEDAGVSVLEPGNEVLSLTALNKSNNRSDYNLWQYNGKNYANFKNFNWISDGWTNNSLLVRGDAEVEILCTPMAAPTNGVANLAMTVIFKLKVDTVLDPDEVIIKCDSGSGANIKITALKATLETSTRSKVFREFAAGEAYEIGFVSHPADGSENDRMIYLYINGTMSGAIRRGIEGSGETIYLTVPANIKISGKYADTYVYSIRYYLEALTFNLMVDLYLLGINDTDTFISEYNSNNVLDTGGTVSINSIPNNIPYIIITGKSSDGTTDVVHEAMNGSTVKPLPRYNAEEILFVDQANPSKNFKIVGGCIRLLGTTTLIYPIKNLRIYSKDKDKVKSKLYIGCDASGNNGILSSTHKYSFKGANENYTNRKSAPVSCLVLKADCSDSSSTHNVGMATFVNTIFLKAGVLTPPLRYLLTSDNTDIRIAIDGFPCYVFYRQELDIAPTFLGKFNLINDKGSEDVFGFASVKGYNNKSDGYRDIDSFKMIRVNKSNVQSQYTPEVNSEYPDWDILRLYALMYYDNYGDLWPIPTFDENDDVISPDENGNTVYDRFGFVYDDDSWAVFFDWEAEANGGNGGWIMDDGSDPTAKVHRHINPTECWEFATNLSTITNEDGTSQTVVDNTNNSRVLFTKSEFKNKKSDGTMEWTDDFDLRYPDDDSLIEEYTSGRKSPKYLKAVCDWLEKLNIRLTSDTLTKDIMKTTFMELIENYFNLDNLIAYFVTTLLFMCVDQMAKNLMLCFFYDPLVRSNDIMGLMRGFLLFYDNDTILGLRNDGYLIYNWDLEFDTIDQDQSLYAFAGYESVLWYNINLCYLDRIKAMYLNMRDKFTMSDILGTFTELVADKYCERIVNIDMVNKYVLPVVYDNKDYLMSLHGPRTSHRTWLINNRVDLFDARYFAGDYTLIYFSFRGGKTALSDDELSAEANTESDGNVKILSLRDWYYAVLIDQGTLSIKKVKEGEYYTFDTPIKVGQSINPLLYGLKYAQSLDLSDLVWNISASTYGGTFPYLEELIFCKADAKHTCSTKGLYANIENHAPILKRMVACNMTAWGTMDISLCNFIEELDVRGSTGISAVVFPSSNTLKKLYLGPGLTNLNLVNKPYITEATIEGASEFNGNITASNISNVAAKMILNLLNKRYLAESRLNINLVDLEIGTEDDPVTLGQTDVGILILLANDPKVLKKSVRGYALVVSETIYRYQYNLLKEKFPELNINCTPTVDNYTITSLSSSFYELGNTLIISTGMDISILNFELGSIPEGSTIFSTQFGQLSYPLNSSVRLDQSKPINERVSISDSGLLTCSEPLENATWSLTIWVHAYPNYYTAEEIAQDTYEKYPGHYCSVLLSAVAVTSISIAVDDYISPNTIYNARCTVYPTNNTKSTLAEISWSSDDVSITKTDSGLGQFTAPRAGSVILVLRYLMFGKTDGDSVLTTTKTCIVNSAVLSIEDAVNDCFLAVRSGLYDAYEAGEFSTFQVYKAPVIIDGQTIHEATTSFTATELLEINSKAFIHILKYLKDISIPHSLEWGKYLTKVLNISIDSTTKDYKFNSSMLECTLPVESIIYSGCDANLFKECTNLLKLSLPNLKLIEVKSTSSMENPIKNQLFYSCGTLTQAEIELPKLLTISISSAASKLGCVNLMFSLSRYSTIELPLLLSIDCVNGSGSYIENMFSSNNNLIEVSMPRLLSYQVNESSVSFKMFEGSNNVKELTMGTIGITSTSVLTLQGTDNMTDYIFSNMLSLERLNTNNLNSIPGQYTFYNDKTLCINDDYTLDWGNTKLLYITTFAEKFFYNCDLIYKWVLPETIQQCPSSSKEKTFLYGSKILIIDLRAVKKSVSWGNIFCGKCSVDENEDATLDTCGLLFLHFNPNTMPDFGTASNPLEGDYPVFIGDGVGNNLFLTYILNTSSAWYRIYDASNFSDLWAAYNRYSSAIANGVDENTAYMQYPCSWDRGISRNRIFPYCMAKWMSRKIFMESLNDSTSGYSWPTLNAEINLRNATTGVEYELEDITGYMLHHYGFKYRYVESPVITSYNHGTLCLAMLATGILQQTLALQYSDPSLVVNYDINNSRWSITANGETKSPVDIEISRSELINPDIYNNENIKSLLEELRNNDYTPTTFDLLLYCSSVTSIKSPTDYNNTLKLTSITLPLNCTVIETYGFRNSLLRTINNIYLVKTLSTNSLSLTPNLTSLMFGLVESLPADVFYDSGIQSVEFDSLTNIDTNAFRRAGSLTSFTDNAEIAVLNVTPFIGVLGLSIKNYTFKKLGTIPNNAFYNVDTDEGDSNIETFSSNYTTTIGINAFRNCPNFKSISANSCTDLGTSAFYNDTKLVSISFEALLTILPFTFYNCNIDASTVKINEDTGEMSPQHDNLVLNIPNVLYISTKAFSSDDGKRMYIGFINCNNVATIGKSAFLNTIFIPTDITWNNLKGIDLRAFMYTQLSKVTFDSPELYIIGKEAFSMSSLVYIDAHSVKTLNDGWLFAHCSNLNHIILGQVTAIPESCFENCTSLKTVGNTNFGSSDACYLLDIKTNAFSGCTSLESINFTTVTRIEQSAFKNCSSLTSVNLPLTYNSGNQIFYGCTSLETLSLPALKNIGDLGLYGCSNLKEISMPSLTTAGLGIGVLEGNTGLEKLTIGCETIFDEELRNKLFLVTYYKNDDLEYTDSNGTVLENQNLYMIENPGILLTLKELTLTNSIEVGEYLFFDRGSYYHNTVLEKFTAEKATSIGTYSFRRNTSLSELNLPECLTINKRCFLECTSLVNVSIPKCTKIDGWGFSGCTSIINIETPEVLNLSGHSLSECSNLDHITVPKLEIIGKNAISNCSKLKYADFGNKDITFTFDGWYGEGLFNNIEKTTYIIIRNKPGSTISSGFGKYSDNTAVKPIYVLDLYEDWWEMEYDSIYNIELTGIYNYPVLELFNSINNLPSTENELTVGITSVLYDDPITGTDKIYTYYQPWNTSLTNLAYEVLSGTKFDTVMLENKSLLIIPAEDSDGTTQASIKITLPDSGLETTVSFNVPPYYVIFEDEEVRRIMLENFDDSDNGKLEWNELNKITDI